MRLLSWSYARTPGPNDTDSDPLYHLNILTAIKIVTSPGKACLHSFTQSSFSWELTLSSHNPFPIETILDEDEMGQQWHLLSPGDCIYGI